MTPYQIFEMANNLIGDLHRLAEAIDPEYAEECADSACTNVNPINSNDKVVRHLVHTAQMINASGLLEIPDNTPCVGCRLHKHPLGYRWYI